jgi:hypothetical protein
MILIGSAFSEKIEIDLITFDIESQCLIGFGLH